MSKSEITKKFNAWKSAIEKLESEKNYLTSLNDNDKYSIRQTKKNIAKYEALSQTLFTEEVKNELDARNQFEKKFESFITENAKWLTETERNMLQKEVDEWNNDIDAVKAGTMREDEWCQKYNYKFFPSSNIYYHEMKRIWDEERSYKNNYYRCFYDLYELNLRVVDYVGTITELNNVRMTTKGLQGVVTGTKGKCCVYGILAGGYNIQRLHVRMLVSRI